MALTTGPRPGAGARPRRRRSSERPGSGPRMRGGARHGPSARRPHGTPKRAGSGSRCAGHRPWEEGPSGRRRDTAPRTPAALSRRRRAAGRRIARPGLRQPRRDRTIWGRLSLEAGQMGWVMHAAVSGWCAPRRFPTAGIHRDGVGPWSTGAQEGLGQFSARRDAEFAVRPAEVHLDGLDRQVQLRRDLAVGEAFGGVLGDPQLGRGERVAILEVGAPEPRAGGEKLVVGALRERAGSPALREPQPGVEVLARGAALVGRGAARLRARRGRARVRARQGCPRGRRAPPAAARARGRRPLRSRRRAA